MTIVNAPRRSAEQLSSSLASTAVETLREIRLPQDRPILLEPVADGRDRAARDGGLDPDGVVRACVRSLLGLAYRTPGFDVQVRAGGDFAVRLHHAEDGLRAQLLDGLDGRACGPDLALTPAAVDSELALLLRA